MKIPPPWYVEAHQLQCSFASSRKMLPTILFLISQSETTESSQPTRSLAVFLAPRNLSVSWPSVFMTPRTTKHKCSKKTIIRNISSKDFTTSHHAQTSPFPSSPILLPIYQVSIHPSPSLFNHPHYYPSTSLI
jgi:hypothetical protein